MEFKKEKELYRFVREAHEKRRKLSHSLETSSLEDHLIALERTIGTHKIHIAGESHNSFSQVDYMHKSIVPLIREKPEKWLILSEHSDSPFYIHNAIYSPTRFYISELANLFKIPVEEAMPPITSREVLTYIKEKSSINEDDIFRFYLTTLVCFIRPLIKNPEKFRLFLNELSTLVGKTPSYLLNMLNSLNSINYEEVRAQVIKHQNNYAKERFYALLEKYSDKSDVLISVGIGHIPSFYDNFNIERFFKKLT